ncbi:26S proteasome regulatory subunit 7 [Coemansia javaensis]|uniref:26S proteasome regulatory subunit 7 homolog n=1 Tax=Coemansia javaensis TaxID=2761396 RepID=A0A9W8HIH6_9FUNG|nr:26S proteasome regulatory subunit 7 [Coemansia javaensis]
MALCDLPDDILHKILVRTLVWKRNDFSPPSGSIDLLAVCRQLRRLALPMVYSLAFVAHSECNGYQTTGLRRLPTNPRAIASAGCVHCVRTVHIEVSCTGSPVGGFNAAMRTLRKAARKWPGVRTLEIMLTTERGVLGWDGECADKQLDDIEAACAELATMLPGVSRLMLPSDAVNTIAKALSSRIAVRYSHQVRELNSNTPIDIPRGTVLSNLKTLTLGYNPIGEFNPLGGPRLLYANPAGLVSLTLYGRLIFTVWRLLSPSPAKRVLTLPKLEKLTIVSWNLPLADSFMPQHYNWPAWRLHLPSLKTAHIRCWSDPFPVVEWLVLPENMELFDILLPSTALRALAGMPGFPSAQYFALSVSPADPENGFANVPAINSILERASSSKWVALFVANANSPGFADMITFTSITHLDIGPVNMDIILGFVCQLTRLVDLKLIYAPTGPVQSDISIPPPDDERLVEPLNSSVKWLYFSAHSVEKLEGFAELKYLLLVLQSLIWLNIPGAQAQPLRKFIDEYSGRAWDWEKCAYKKPVDGLDEEPVNVLDEKDIELLKAYGEGPYAKEIKDLEKSIRDKQKAITERVGVKELETGLAPPSAWDLPADKQRLRDEHALHVARCTKIIGDGDSAKYLIGVKNVAKFVVALAQRVSPTDIEEGMRVGVDRTKYQIQVPLPPKIDPSVTMMQIEEKPDVTYADVGGCKEQIEKLREVVELPLLEPERFINLGIDPPKGVLLYGPPGTGKTLCARAVANRTDATFVCVIGSELVQRYVGEGARMVRDLFEMARTKKACIIFFDEVDAIGGARFDDGTGGDNEVQRTMLELINQLDGFDPRGNIKVIMATNRPDTLDPALMRPGRLDRKVEFSLPDQEGRAHILRIHARSMSVERDIRFDLIARLCPNSTGAELRSVCTEAGMFAIRARRKVATEKDFLEAVNKVIKSYAKFSSTPKYMTYN